MNINYYNLYVSFLLIGIFLFIIGAVISIIIGTELYDDERYRSSKLSILIGALIIVSAIILFFFSYIYGNKYKKNVYEQCVDYMNEVYHVRIVDYKELYSKKGSVYVRGGDAYIKTYFYNEGNLYYVEYEINVLYNGIIKHQNVQIYKYDGD